METEYKELRIQTHGRLESNHGRMPSPARSKAEARAQSTPSITKAIAHLPARPAPSRGPT
jgi:hypothetical protein